MNKTIRLVAIDQDGTLLDSHGQLSEKNSRAIRRAVAQGVMVIIATGKSQASGRAVMAALGLNAPGVFTQGLVITAADGSVLFEQGLVSETAVSVINFAQTHQLPLLAYCGERMLAENPGKYTDLLHDHYREPKPEVVGSLIPWVGQITMNKLLISDEVTTARTRAALEQLVGDNAVVVQAVPHYLEVLPPNTSKGKGLRWLLAHLNIDPADVLAIGDGENDLEMLEFVGVGVAMGNAGTAVRAVANHVVATNDESGVAEAIETFVLNGEWRLEIE